MNPRDSIKPNSFFSKSYSDEAIKKTNSLKTSFRARRSFAYLERFSGINPEIQSPLSLINLEEALKNASVICGLKTNWQEDYKKIYEAVRKINIVLKHALLLEDYEKISQNEKSLFSIRERYRQGTAVNNVRTGNKSGRDDNVYFSLGAHDHPIAESFSLNPTNRTVVVSIALKDEINLKNKGEFKYLWFGPHHYSNSKITDYTEYGTTKRIIFDIEKNNVHYRIYKYERATGECFEFEVPHSLETVVSKDLYKFISLKLLLELCYIGEPYHSHVLNQLDNTEIVEAAINYLFRYPTFDAKIPVKVNLTNEHVSITLPKEISEELNEHIERQDFGFATNDLTNLFDALAQCNFDEIKKIIFKRPDLINFRTTGRILFTNPTPLLRLLNNFGNDDITKIAEFLLDQGASILLQDAFHYTPIHHTVSNNKLDNFTLRLLQTRVPYTKDSRIKFLLNPNIETNNGGLSEDLTPLEKACYRKDNNMIQILLDNHAYPTGNELIILAKFKRDVAPPQLLFNSATIAQKRRSLICAAAFKNEQFIKYMLDPNINKDFNPQNPRIFLDDATSIEALSVLINDRHPKESYSIIELLCKNGININAKDEFGRNALFFAQHKDYTKNIAELLLSYGSEMISEKDVLPENIVFQKSSVAIIKARDHSGKAYYLMGRKSVSEKACDLEYMFPGGLIEKNEDALTAAKREAFEETGIDLSQTHGQPILRYNQIKKNEQYSYRYSEPDLNIQINFYLFDIGRLKNVKHPYASSDFGFVRWLSPEDFRKNIDKISVKKSNLELIIEIEKNDNLNAKKIISLLDEEHGIHSNEANKTEEIDFCRKKSMS